MSAPDKSHSTRPLRVTALGAAASIPWCCLVPAVLAAAGTASSLAGRWLGVALPFFLILSVGLFARAHYLVWVKGHASPAARVAVVLLTLAAAGLWAFRLVPR